MALTDEHYSRIIQRAFPVLIRRKLDRLLVARDAAQAELEAKAGELVAARTAFAATPTAELRDALLAAQAAAKAANVVRQAEEANIERAETVEGKLELLRDHWEQLCPECAARAGHKPLEEFVEDEEIALLELDQTAAQAALDTAKAELDARKRG